MLYAVIGDVHGCANEFADLLDLVETQFPTAIKIQLGDLLHKGPDSSGAVEIARTRLDGFVIGNHEEKHLRWLAHERAGREHGMKNISDYATVNLTPDQEDFITNQSLFYFQDQQDHLLIVHGGIAGKTKRLPAQSRWYLTSASDKKYYKHLLFTRYQDATGNPVALGSEQPDDKWWADVYDGRFGTCMYGHQSYDPSDVPAVYPHALGVDLGCVYGNKLCAAIMRDGQHIETLTVDAQAKYRNHGEYKNE